MHNCKACKARITLGIYCEVCERQVGLISDIDALTAERDELQRRLDAVVADARRWAKDVCYCDWHTDRTLRCEYCEQSDRLAAIAGGTQP